MKRLAYLLVILALLCPAEAWAQKLVLANEATAAQRRVYFQLVDPTDFSPETGEAGGQPQVSSNGAAWTNTGIGTLTAIGNGRYYADLTQALVATAGTRIETRYKSANTAEAVGDSVDVVGFDPHDAVRMGMTALPNAAADAAGGLIISDAGGLAADTLNSNVSAILVDTGTTLDGKINTIDTVVDAILVDTGTTLDARIPAALVSGRMSSDTVALSGSTAAADRLEANALTIVPCTVSTSTFSPTTTEFSVSDITEATADHYNGRVIIFTSGPLQYQAVGINDYSLAGGQGHFTVTTMTEAPANGNACLIF